MTKRQIRRRKLILAAALGIAAGITLPAHAVITINGSVDPDYGTAKAIQTNNTGFGLKSTGQSLYLFDKLANGGGELSAVSFGVQAADFSIGRLPNGSTNWVLGQESIGSFVHAAL